MVTVLATNKWLYGLAALGAAMILIAWMARAGANGSAATTSVGPPTTPKAAIIKPLPASDTSTAASASGSSNHTQVTVNGQTVAVGANGSVDTTVQDGSQTSHISVQNQSSQSSDSGGSSNSQTSNTVVDTEGQ